MPNYLSRRSRILKKSSQTFLVIWVTPVGLRVERTKPFFQAVSGTPLPGVFSCWQGGDRLHHTDRCALCFLTGALTPNYQHTLCQRVWEERQNECDEGHEKDMSGRPTVRWQFSREVVMSWACGRNVLNVHLTVFNWKPEWRLTNWCTCPPAKSWGLFLSCFLGVLLKRSWSLFLAIPATWLKGL